jgi:hypothetical protein
MNTMEKSMSSANGKSPILSKVHVLLQNVANSKEKCPRRKSKKKSAPVFVPIPVGVWWYNLECVV